MKRIEGMSACSACFNTSEGTHVDLDAAWDGPVTDYGPIDDLVLCESCVKHAYDLLDTKDDKKIKVALNEASEALDVADKWKAYANRLEAAIEVRPEPVK